MKELHIELPDARLRYQVRGDERGELIVCAHGFPDCERSFRHQIPPLVEAGFRGAVVTMRGYAPSTPSVDGRYDAARLGLDLLAVADALSPAVAVHLLGHDWGAIAAYAASAIRPNRVASLTTAAVPHLRVATPRFATPTQARRSWYMALFQLRWLAERAVLKDDMALIDRLWRDWSPGYLCPAEEMAHIKNAIRPNLSAVLGYYRALRSPKGLLGDSRRAVMKRTQVPALYLHGADDGCIGKELTQGLDAAYAAGLQTHVVSECGHFLHIERPDEINALLLAFISAHRA